ncbi:MULTISPECIES: ABC transporter permease [Pseudonocardia]|uniref:Taurine transporter subunit n=2 Tax=Pseudonocardia TaxID=1847 RepID=A0A1Y2MSQ1_PSEAH|nr:MULTISPECIES: ABC transporter permease subunit [Pseudonocardia]OSY37999.1 taurine transporter subunit [Pseudonocardia autotrophica]TDN74660.1 NitT/TauT family transport system permease protein/putative hydroxymethylpyrimidine transport system permease protein [Pseudonocardia autotrophica]BBG05432.1 ABC transporter [Pseudonocardia autotrophica]GEC26397.1 ABC transporter [Pseudonocardia saturnea]
MNAAPAERYAPRAATRWLTVPGTVLLLILFVAAWSAAIRILAIGPLTLPSPSGVLAAVADKPGVYLRNGWNSLVEAVLGLGAGVVVGISVAGLVVRRRTARAVSAVYASALMAVPVVALIPLANAVFGFGMLPRVVVVAMAVGPLMFTFALNGFSAADPGTVELFRSIAASPVRVVWALHLPAAMPHLMSGLRVAAPTSFTVALLAQYFGGSLENLGTYIKSASVQLRVDNLWGAALTAFVFCAVLFWLAIALDRMLVRRH